MAEIRVNEGEWQQLDEAQQGKVIHILKANGLLREEDTFVPDPAAVCAAVILADKKTRRQPLAPTVRECLIGMAERACHASCRSQFEGDARQIAHGIMALAGDCHRADLHKAA